MVWARSAARPHHRTRPTIRQRSTKCSANARPTAEPAIDQPRDNQALAQPLNHAQSPTPACWELIAPGAPGSGPSAPASARWGLMTARRRFVLPGRFHPNTVDVKSKTEH